MSQVEKEREEMRHQLVEQKRQCRGLLQQIAALRQEQQHNVTSGGGKALHCVWGRGSAPERATQGGGVRECMHLPLPV